MKFHPIAEIFPMLPEAELKELAEDIKQNGQSVPILLYDGQILDGRNRFRACEIAGASPEYEIYKGEDPLKCVISLNLRRRHLDESQRGMVAAKIVNTTNGGDRKSDQRVNLPPDITLQDAAKLLNVSRKTVVNAKAILRDNPELVPQIESGEKTIHEVQKDFKRADRVEKIVEISKGNKELKTDKAYPVLYCDPPWRYEHCESDSRAIENQYPTMELGDICVLPIGKITTPDCILFMWATSPKLAEAMSVLKAWGFIYRTCAVWVKDKIGMGYYFRQQHELLLVATKGNIPVPQPSARVSSIIEGKREKHSAKPEYVYGIIESMYPEFDKCELFQRTPRKGWHGWGNQANA